MKDDLTPKQRKKAIREGKPVDRLPNLFSVEDVAHKITGIKVSEFNLDVKKQIAATVAAYERFELDIVEVVSPAGGVIGNEMVFPDNSSPYIKAPLDLDEEALANINLVDAKTHPVFADFFRVLDGLIERVGDKTEVGVLTPGPLTTAARAIGVDNFLKKMITNPDYIHLLLATVTDVIVASVRSLSGYDVIFDIKDPVASGSLLRPEFYRTFAKPYQTRLIKAMNEACPDNTHVLHICGNTSKIWEDMAETGASIISIDNAMDLEQVKQRVGDKISISGNIKPSDTMLLGTEQDVVNNLKSCLKKAYDAKKTYYPAFGCALPLGTPIQNLDVLYEAHRKYAKFPINVEEL
jgi:uroporphyrinogen decarboxylase